MATPAEIVKAGFETAMQPLSDLFMKLAGPFCEELGEGLRYPGMYLRTALGMKLFERTRLIVERAGFEPVAVAPKVFLPILQNASLETDETLRERWAALLANAAHPHHCESVIPAFPEVLKQLTPVEACFLERVYSETLEDDAKRSNPENESLFTMYPFGRPQLRSETLAMISDVLLSDLVRMGLISRDREESPWATGALITYHSLSDFGRAFVKACRPPELTT